MKNETPAWPRLVTGTKFKFSSGAGDLNTVVTVYDGERERKGYMTKTNLHGNDQVLFCYREEPVKIVSDTFWPDLPAGTKIKFVRDLERGIKADTLTVRVLNMTDKCLVHRTGSVWTNCKDLPVIVIGEEDE